VPYRYPPISTQQSLSRCTYLPRCLRSTVACGKTSWHVIITQGVKTKSRIVRTQASQRTFAGKGADTSSSLHYTRTVNLARVQCEWSVLSARKLSLQELNQSIGIKLMTSGFLVSGGENARFCGRPWRTINKRIVNVSYTKWMLLLFSRNTEHFLEINLANS